MASVRHELKERAYQHLKSLILTEEIPLNGLLSERGVAEDLGMSKTPVRLAIERLAHEGFVRVSPQQGVVVVSLAFDEIVEYIDFRLALESFVVRSITGRLTREQIERLRAALREQDAVVPEGAARRGPAVTADMAFHKLLASFQGNRQIARAMDRQHDMLFRVASRVYRRHPHRLQESRQEHEAIGEAIIDGDVQGATERIEKHISAIKTLLITGGDDRS